MVDGLIWAATLSQDLPVVSAGGDVFDVGADAPVFSVVVVVDDSAVGSAAWSGGGVDSVMAAIAEDWPAAVQWRGHGVAGHDDIVAVARPAVTDCDDVAASRADDDLGVDAAAVVSADRGDFLAVYREQAREHRHQVVNDPVHGRLAGSQSIGW